MITAEEFTEQVLWAVAVHGPGVVFEDRYWPQMEWLARKHRARYMRVVLAVGPEAREELDRLALAEHGRSCACWTCLVRFRVEVERGSARIRVRRRIAEHRALDRVFAGLQGGR